MSGLNMSQNYPGAALIDPEEKWRIEAHTKEKDGKTDRETSLLKLDLPNGKKWNGTIQDFMAIETYAANALSQLRRHCPADGHDEVKELEELLGHFKS